MLKQLFSPTKANLLGWAGAAAVVGAYQYFTTGPDAVDDTLVFNEKIIAASAAATQKRAAAVDKKKP